MDRVESDPIIHDCEAFERWLRDEGLEDSTVRTYVTDLKRLSRDLEIEIGPATIGGHDDAEELADRHKKEQGLGIERTDYRTAARRYADFVQASRTAQEDDETRFRKTGYRSNTEGHRIVLDLLRRMEMPVTKAQVGTAFADHLGLTAEQRTEMAPDGRIPQGNRI